MSEDDESSPKVFNLMKIIEKEARKTTDSFQLNAPKLKFDAHLNKFTIQAQLPHLLSAPQLSNPSSARNGHINLDVFSQYQHMP